MINLRRLALLAIVGAVAYWIVAAAVFLPTGQVVTTGASGLGPGLLRGYLTTAGARTFGAALGRLAAADRGDASYGQNGFTGDGTALTLAGDPSHSAREAATRPQADPDTLTVRGTDLAGQPDNGDQVQVLDADNLKLLPGWSDTALVTPKATATDAAGGSVTQTITDAYRVG